jgi:hypothetical protein
MPVNATGRKYLTDLLKGVSTFHDDTHIRFNYATVTLGGTATDVDPIGTPVIWVDANSQFEIYVAQDIAATITTGGSPLPDGSVIALTVGDEFGVGFNKHDLDLNDDPDATVLFRGDAGVVDEGIEWGTADATAQAAFWAQLEKQRITRVANAEVVTPAYTS